MAVVSHSCFYRLKSPVNCFRSLKNRKVCVPQFLTSCWDPCQTSFGRGSDHVSLRHLVAKKYLYLSWTYVPSMHYVSEGSTNKFFFSKQIGVKSCFCLRLCCFYLIFYGVTHVCIAIRENRLCYSVYGIFKWKKVGI